MRQSSCGGRCSSWTARCIRLAPGGPAARRFVGKFVKTLMGKVGQWGGFLESADLPVVAQVVRVSFDGGDPVAWRDGAGPVSESEPRAMTVALALIADFVDRVDGLGACEQALLTALGDCLD
ncbi:hypothetical protein AB0G73_36945 [Streptomyces sp. NPDC020719]|uniref:hypothetical protein n=1 Tax=Streptomyces sp. NPDC020719 TaxID=3154896 RepID=UPI0033C56252